MERTTEATSSQPSCAPIVDRNEDRSTDSKKITISLYENEVPSFVEAEMERLYENIYTSLSRLRIYGATRNASTYVVRERGKVITIFLFRRKAKEVKVLNEQIGIDEEDIYRFSSTIFTAFKSVTVISFWAIQTAIRRLPFPYQKCNCLSDVVLTLPGTAEEYLANLGKSTRANIKRYAKKLYRSFPSFRYEVYAKAEVNEKHIRDIIRLSSARMALKNKPGYITEEEAQRLINLARVYGFVGVAMINGRVGAGLVCYCVGANYFMQIIAHDPRYDDYKVGMYCAYLTICECIARGGKEYRFMESSHRYKFNLLGVWLDFDCLTVYRSRTHFLLNGGRIIKAASRAYARRMGLWFLHAEYRAGLVSRAAAQCVRALRNLKRSRYAFSVGGK